MSRAAVVLHMGARLRREPGDAVLGAGLLALALAEAAGLPGSDVRLVAICAAPVMTLPLLWRRDAPLPVLGITIGAFAAQTALGVPQNAQIAATAVVVVASYSAAVYAEVRPALGGLGLALLLAGVTVPATPDAGPGDLAFAALLVGASWGAGRVVRARTAEARAQERRASEAERDAEERARRAVEAERRRIARELHDIIAHSISLMVIQAGAAERVLATPERATGPLRVVQEAGRQALVDMKRLLGTLRGDEPAGPGLQPQPGLRELEALVGGVRATGLSVCLVIEGTPYPVTRSLELTVYRTVQEALTNVLKHAGASTARVTLRYGDGYLEVEVTDDGTARGCIKPGGRGLTGMRERVDLFGGQLHAGPRDGGGFIVRARLPARRAGEPAA